MIIFSDNNKIRISLLIVWVKLIGISLLVWNVNKEINKLLISLRKLWGLPSFIGKWPSFSLKEDKERLSRRLILLGLLLLIKEHSWMLKGRKLKLNIYDYIKQSSSPIKSTLL